MNSVSDSALAMPDVQSSLDTRRLPIQRVGVRGVRHPLLVMGTDGEAMPTIADWELTVALPAEEKGTHMSRFVAQLEQYRRRPMTPALFCEMAETMLPLLNARQGDIAAAFTYFVDKVAPVSGVSSLMDYQVHWKARASENEETWFELTVVVPVTSLCPCSKAISEYGAHNQRSHVTVSVVLQQPVSIDLPTFIAQIENQASCELWGLLKRSDEKYVTERAYDNPKFVEDLVRDVAMTVKNVEGVTSFRVAAENFESIHNHSAYAVVEG